MPDLHSIASGLSLQNPSSGTFPKNKELISSGGVPSQSSGFAIQYSPPSSKALPKNSGPSAHSGSHGSSSQYPGLILFSVNVYSNPISWTISSTKWLPAKAFARNSGGGPPAKHSLSSGLS